MGSEVSAEGEGLQGGEEGVELGQVGSLVDFLLLDGFDDGGEAALEVEGGKRDLGGFELSSADIRLSSTPGEIPNVILVESGLQKCAEIITYDRRITRNSKCSHALIQVPLFVELVRDEPEFARCCSRHGNERIAWL